MAHLTSVPYLDDTTIPLYLDEFAAELWNRFHGAVTLDIFICGGSALVLKYPLVRKSTVDIDSYIRCNVPSFNVSHFIKAFAASRSLPADWLNEDVIRSPSFSMRLLADALPFTEFHNCVRVSLVNDLDQLCMKAVAGRDKDIKDIRNLCRVLRDAGCCYADYSARLSFFICRCVG